MSLRYSLVKFLDANFARLKIEKVHMLIVASKWLWNLLAILFIFLS